MIRVFKHYVPNAVLLLGVLDFMLLIAAAEGGWDFRAWQIDMLVEPIWTRLPQLLSFAAPLMIAMIAVGAYQADVLVSIRQAAMRLMVAISLGALFLAVLFFVMPRFTFWRSNLFYAMLLAGVGLVMVRILFGRF
ncbi:MAG: sugar transferase, partial [Sphingomonas sp.]|nr:sugar transferase [Sphingomonas sp.]